MTLINEQLDEKLRIKISTQLFRDVKLQLDTKSEQILFGPICTQLYYRLDNLISDYLKSEL